MSSIMVNPPPPYYDHVLTMEDVVEAATAAVHTISRLGYDCYIFGSVASALYGATNATPNDVDIAVFAGDQSAEEIKMAIASYSYNFILKPHAMGTDHSLYFKFQGSIKECRVDIVAQGAYSAMLPFIPNDRIVYLHGLPLPTLKVLVLFKLLGWHVSKAGRTASMRAMAARYEGEIIQLLDLVRSPHPILTWCPDAMHERARIVVKGFAEERSTSLGAWVLLGFDVVRVWEQVVARRVRLAVM